MTFSNPVLYKRLQPIQIAVIQSHIDDRSEISPILSHLQHDCEGVICGEPMVIFHDGAVKDGSLIEAAIPVSSPVETAEIYTRLLEPAPVLSMLHLGVQQTIPETLSKIYAFKRTHAWTVSLLWREIYKRLETEHPENNVTEVQVVLHEWDRLFAEAADKLLGTALSRQITAGRDAITIETTSDEYANWIMGAMSRLDEMVSDEEKKCQLVSQCAHVFPQERIEYLRTLYLSGGVDKVLCDMYTDTFWYESPIRRDNVLYMRKNPYNPEAYKNALTAAEKRKAYCHCAFMRRFLDEVPSHMSPSFCYCGAGWYRRLWEGILSQPVKIEYAETLLRGNDQCTFTITLPLELTGEFSPQLSGH